MDGNGKFIAKLEGNSDKNSFHTVVRLLSTYCCHSRDNGVTSVTSVIICHVCHYLSRLSLSVTSVIICHVSLPLPQELISTFSSFVQQFESKFVSLAVQEEEQAAAVREQLVSGGGRKGGQLRRQRGLDCPQPRLRHSEMVAVRLLCALSGCEG